MFSQLDLIFWSTGAGWSEAILRVDGREHRLVMTHIFSRPSEEIAKATRALIEGRPTAAFTWLAEPGTFVFEFERLPAEASALRGRCRMYSDLHPRGVSPDVSVIDTIEFTTHLTYWAELVRAGLDRAAKLSLHHVYSSWNDGEAPDEDLAAIERYLAAERPRRRWRAPNR